MRLFVIIAVCLLSLPIRLAAQHPNDSIVPERPKPTPYGMQISRVDDLEFRKLDAKSVDELPALAPYLEAFEEAEAVAGPYDFSLTEPLHDLGRVHHASGMMRDAMDYYRRALHLARVNDGLYTPAQLPVLTDMINANIEIGNIVEADALHAVRFKLQRRIYPPGSEELDRATDDYITWQRQAYLQSMGGDTFLRLLDMYEVHTEDIERLEKANPNDPSLVPHLYDRLLVEYLISQYDGEKQSTLQINVSGPSETDPSMGGQLEGERFRQLREFNFRNGLRALESIVEIEESKDEVDAMALANARLALGDWYLWWQRSGRALQNYELAWAVLSQDGSALTDPDALFPHPVELPDTKVFHSDGTTLSEDVTASARVSMGVSRKGRVRDIEVLEQKPPEDMGARVVLFRLLKEVRFRPIVREGAAVPFASLVREYHYQY